MAVYVVNLILRSLLRIIEDIVEFIPCITHAHEPCITHAHEPCITHAHEPCISYHALHMPTMPTNEHKDYLIEPQSACVISCVCVYTYYVYI